LLMLRFMMSRGSMSLSYLDQDSVGPIYGLVVRLFCRRYLQLMSAPRLPFASILMEPVQSWA
jgi:hypothetical protein